MRSIFIAVLILVPTLVALLKPHVGVLVWAWVSHMNPHRLSYGFAVDAPFLLVVGGVTAAGMALAHLSKREIYRFPIHPIVFAFALYVAWTLISSLFAFPDAPLDGDQADQYLSFKLSFFLKICVFTLVSMIVMQSPNRIKAFVWILAFSLAFLSVKGGIFTILQGGGARVQGASGQLNDNNQLAMALSMMLPIAFYLFEHPPHKLLKWPILGGVGLSAIAILGTQSRGGFVALAAVLAVALLKSRRKIAYLALVVPLAIGAWGFMPDSWHNRIDSTREATNDASFIGRVSMWRFSTNLVDDHPVTGGGFNIFYNRIALAEYMPPGFEPRAPHSVYFEVLGEHGYVGLVLFLSLLLTAWYSSGETAKHLRKAGETKWLGDLSAAIQLSFVGFAVGGLTVNIATLELFYHLLALAVLVHLVGRKTLIDIYGDDGGLWGQDGGKREKWAPSPDYAGRLSATRD